MLLVNSNTRAVPTLMTDVLVQSEQQTPGGRLARKLRPSLSFAVSRGVCAGVKIADSIRGPGKPRF